MINETLFHGSKSGLSGEIRPDVSRIECDFGQGFYIGDNIEQAKMIAFEGISPVIYSLKLDLSELKTYNFDSDILWVLYVGVKRKKIDVQKYAKLRSFVDDIDKSDVIIGKIADDRLAYSFQNFLDGLLSDKALTESMKYIDLGSQYVCKTDKACSHVEIIGSFSLTKQEVQILKKEKSRMLGVLIGSVDDVHRKYRRQGLYVDELLEEWK